MAEDHAVYANLYKHRGDQKNARENFVTAIEMFKECGADGWVEKYEKELAVLN